MAHRRAEDSHKPRARLLALAAPLALFLLAALLVPAIAFAHGRDGDAHGRDALGWEGRIPGLGNFKRASKTTYRYLPAKGEYKLTEPGRPPRFVHEDPLFEEDPPFEEEEGEAGEDPEHEVAPICRTSGRRIVPVYTHRPGSEKPVPTAIIRSRVRTVNWQMIHWSSVSSEGARVVQLAVDCDAEGEISIASVATQDSLFWHLIATVNNVLGTPTGTDAVKYMVFDDESGKGGGGSVGSGPVEKSPTNPNARLTDIGVSYSDTWPGQKTAQTPTHELLHTLGAVAPPEGVGPVTTMPPYGDGAGHCIDGWDVLCYETGGSYEGQTYSTSYCEKFEGFRPIDCNENTYFDAGPEPGSWLDTHWNVAGPEDPFLVAPPSEVTTEPVASLGKDSASLAGTFNPEGYDISYHFDYGPTEEYGSSTASETIDFGTEATEVGAVIEELEEGGATYHYRLVVESGDFGTLEGEDVSFETPPSEPPPAQPKPETEAATSVTGEHATLHAAVDPEGTATQYYFEYGPSESEEYGLKAPIPGKPLGSGSEGAQVSQLAPDLSDDTTYHFRVVAQRGAEKTYGEELTFKTLKLPDATTEAASGVGVFVATLHAKANPQGMASTYHFEYGTEKGYAYSTATGYGHSTPTKSIASGLEDVALSEDIGELLPNKTYHVRLVVENGAGTRYGEDKEFRMADVPEATTRSATFVGAGLATVNGTVNPHRAATSYHFEWSTQAEFDEDEEAYAHSSAAASVETIPIVQVSEALSGLAEDTTYHYRLVAENEGGSAYGLDRTFSTGSDLTSLCSVAEEGSQCSAENVFPVETSFAASADEPLKITIVDERGSGTITCQSSQLSGKLVSAAAHPLDIGIEKWSLSGCIGIDEESCSAKAQNLPYAGSLTWTEGTDGSLGVEADGAGEPGWRIGSCTYNDPAPCTFGPEADFVFEGGSPAQLSMPETTLKASTWYAENWECTDEVEQATLAAVTFSITAPEAAYVAHRPAPPLATTEAASEVKATRATLNGTVNPEGTATEYHFEWASQAEFEEAEEEGYAHSTADKSAGSGTEDVEASEQIEGLNGATIYHYRVAASNEVDTTYGDDETFETEAIDTASRLAAMSVTEPFDGSAESLERFETEWSALGWVTSTTPKGTDTTTGWKPPTPGKPSGAFYESSFADTGSGIGAVATLAASSQTVERYFSLWLDMPSPAETRAGYELRFTLTSTDTYDVTLSKWVAGEETELASETSYSFPVGSSFAIVDQGGTVSAWTDTGSGFEELLSAEDSAFEAGKAGIEGWGAWTRLSDFKVGSLRPPKATTEAASEVKATRATLNGTINPEGTATEYHFEWASQTEFEAAGYAHSTADESAGSGTAGVEASEVVKGLNPGTTYHFRIVAESEAGDTVYGEDESFETEAIDTAGQLAEMAVTEPFDGSSESLERFETEWSALGWTTGEKPKGTDTTTGWKPASAGTKINGASYEPSFADTGAGIGAVATLDAEAEVTNRHLSLWLDMPSPGETRAGYELRFEWISTDTYDVTLSKWVAGEATELASETSYSFAVGSSFAIVDQGGAVSAWTDTGSKFEALLSAEDSAFEEGKAGIEGTGSATRLTDFKAGSL